MSQQGRLNTQQIKDMAKALIAGRSGGIRYSELVNEILKQYPETPRNTINGCVWNLDAQFPESITKPSRGLFKPLGVPEDISPGELTANGNTGMRLRESDFYSAFAEWLQNDLDEVNGAIELGGAFMRSKWGTPDVVGVYRPRTSDLIKFQSEIISAEIKISPCEPIVAFGQAIAYRLFSTKTYIVMPITITEEDESRLESLCMLFGLGLVLFELDPENPKFSIRVRAQRFSPDMFYVNEFADGLQRFAPEKFEVLFG